MDADPPRLPEAEFERARGFVPRVQSHHRVARRKDDRGGSEFYQELRREVFAFAARPKESGNMKEGPMGRVQVLEGPATKRAALYLRTSTADQSPEMQRYDLERLAAQRGFVIVETYVDQASGAKARRPGLERMMADARHAKFDVVLVWASDRLARSTSHFLQTLDELGHLGVEF